MIRLLCFVLAVMVSPFKSKARLEAQNATLRLQLIVLRRKLRGRVRLTNNDRWFFVQLYRWFPSILTVLTIIRPETLVRWHRAGFRCYWRGKSRSLGGRPQIETDLGALIRRMSVENPLWGAPRIHGELLKLGFEVAQSSVAKYMIKRRGPPSQGWRTFLRNHAPDIAAMDLFVVPTIGFDLLYAFVIVRLDRRGIVWVNVTTNPTAEWIARQLTEAFPWDEAPRYLVRDRDRIYGTVVTRRLRAMGIRDKPTASASPWQNGFADGLIGSIRRECVDHIIVLGEAHLRRILRSYACYYNDIRTHRWIKMRQSLARFSGLELSVHTRFLADFITTTSGFRFSVHTGFRRVFERVVEACIAAGLVGGEGFAVDASLIQADANKQRSIAGQDWHKDRNPKSASRAVKEYLATLDDTAWGAASDVVPKFVSPSDPAAQWTGAHKGPARLDSLIAAFWGK